MAAAPGVSYREVKNTSLKQKWKDISVPLGDGGAGSGYLLDQKSADRAGGYGYRDSARLGSPTRNRFIYWRTHQDVLELEEISLDHDIHGGCVRFRFQGASTIGDVNVHESHGNVVILVATTTSVHRLMFPHPNRLQKYDNIYLQGAEKMIPSIFTEASVVLVQDPTNCHNFNLSGVTTAHQVAAAASWLTTDGEAIFALAMANSGSILIIKLPPHGIQGIVTQHELKHSSMMQRLWTGIVPSAIRGGSDANDVVTSLVLHPVGNDTFVFAVSRDHKLRMWSCKSYECVMVADLLEYLPNSSDPEKLSLGDEGHILKKSVASSIQALFLGVFLSFADQCQFCILQPVLSEGRHQLTHLTTVFGPQDDLVDFCVTETSLWSLWSSTHSDIYATCASIEYYRPGIQCLQMVTMEPSEVPELVVPSHLEPREFYMEQIFYPGKFSTHAVIKALNIFKRSLDASNIQDTIVPRQALKAEVMAVIEHEIQSNASNFNITEDEYQNLQLQQWAKFYSCCVQYHQRDAKPVGLFADPDTGLIGMIKKGATSFFRSCSSIEHLSLTPQGECHIEDFEPNLILWEDELLFREVIELCECLKLIRRCLTDEYIYSFEQDLYHTQHPQGIADSIVAWLTDDLESEERRHTVQEVCIKLQNIGELPRAVNSLFQLLDLAQKQPDFMGLEPSRQLSLGHLFSSDVGINSLAHSVQQLAQTRLDLSRDLLLFLTLATHVADQTGLSVSVLNQIKSDLRSKACVLVRAYFVVKWSTESLLSPVSSAQVDLNMRVLEALGLLETVGTATSQALNDAPSLVLLELFLRGQGGGKVKDFLSQDALFDEDPCSLWTKTLSPFVLAVAQILWPYNSSPCFGEFLLHHCQYSTLQEYVRLTKDWCDMNKSTNKFFSALCHLTSGEAQKAMECFQEVPLDVAGEELLVRVVGDEGEDADVRVVYFLRVLNVFEQLGYPHLAVTIARNAVSFADPDDQFVPTLWSKVFKNQLEMGHNEDAYNAMLANPDKERRRDCLRQFLVVLCERSELQTLVQLPYRDRHVVLEEEVVSILEARARSIDLTKHNYYDLLYAFHMFRHNYRKAGTIMYEYGMRLGREVLNLKGLQKQAKCYLAALNALRLINPDYAWIVKPPTEDQQDGSAAKRGFEGDVRFHKKRQLVVLELEDVEKEYMLVHARLQLVQKSPDAAFVTGGSSAASEIIGLLVNVGLFDSAVNICKMFNMPLTPVFEGLASRCVTLADNSESYMTGDNEYTSEAWGWLQQNELAPANATRDGSSTDHAWRLLQTYLEKHEDGSTLYHKCAAVKFLSQGFSLPPWLASKYKELNAAELLRLYLDYDLLQEASVLTLEYIDAVLGKGYEYFGLKTYLHSGSPAVWLPYSSIDQLLSALDEVETEPLYKEFHHKIHTKLDEYFATAETVSGDTLKAESSRYAMIQRAVRQGHSFMET